jgi:hypothetical protein
VGRYIGIRAGILVLFWIITSPETAAATVANNIIMILKSIAKFDHHLRAGRHGVMG